jgi:hypothetical protein
VTSICFLDGARFSDVQGFLRAFHLAIQETPGSYRHADALRHLLLGRREANASSTCLHVVWLNSEVSRRTLGAQAAVPGRGGENAFDAATRWLAACPGVDLILL